MSNPEQLRQMLNPQNMQAMMQMQQAMQQLQGSGLMGPGGGAGQSTFDPMLYSIDIDPFG